MHIINKDIREDAPVVFLQHGLNSSAEKWIMNKDKSPAFVLAKAGFDVWLGNSRGVMYSRGHATIDPQTDPERYFDYSFYEMGKFDAPAMVDLVIQKTGKKKVAYVGHSQGATLMYSALAYDHGNIRDKISAFLSLAPIVTFSNSENSFILEMSSNWQLQ